MKALRVSEASWLMDAFLHFLLPLAAPVCDGGLGDGGMYTKRQTFSYPLLSPSFFQYFVEILKAKGTLKQDIRESIFSSIKAIHSLNQ